MKVGDLVKLKKGATRMGVMVDVIQKKCWRTHERGSKIDWDSIEPEPHGVVMFGDDFLNIPTVDLEVVKK